MSEIAEAERASGETRRFDFLSSSWAGVAHLEGFDTATMHVHSLSVGVLAT